MDSELNKTDGAFVPGSSLFKAGNPAKGKGQAKKHPVEQKCPEFEAEEAFLGSALSLSLLTSDTEKTLGAKKRGWTINYLVD